MSLPEVRAVAWGRTPDAATTQWKRVGVGMSILYQAHQDDTLPRGWKGLATWPVLEPMEGGRRQGAPGMDRWKGGVHHHCRAVGVTLCEKTSQNSLQEAI